VSTELTHGQCTWLGARGRQPDSFLREL
jgi:hypothetical protein